jgi:hypothetical protein
MWCQNICVIKLKGCINSCSDFFDNQNSGHLHTGATPFDLLLYVNSAAPGFAAFIAALNLLLPPCNLNTAPGLQAGVQAPYVAGGTDINISSLEFDAINGTPYVVSSGPVRFVVIATSPTDLAADINNIFGAGNVTYNPVTSIITFVAVAPGIVVNNFAAPSGYISIVPQVYQNYVGE